MLPVNNCSQTEFSYSGVFVREAFNTTTQNVKEFILSQHGQAIIGFGLGLALPFVYSPLMKRVVETFGISNYDPFNNLEFSIKVLLVPIICFIGPDIEENYFRGSLQDSLKESFRSFYIREDFSYEKAISASKISAIFFSSIVFGLTHLTNALFFCVILFFSFRKSLPLLSWE